MTTEGEETWVKDLQNFMNRGPGVVVRLRGLPYDCTPKQVVDFFRRGEFPAEVIDSEDGVFFVRKSDGKATGDAYVLFESDSVAMSALSKNRQLIGVRYIELFIVPPADVEMVVRRTLENKNKTIQSRTPVISYSAGIPNNNNIAYGPVRDCLRLRGLPFEANVQNLLDFLGVYASNITQQGVHMVYNHLGQPSGEAIVRMTSELAAATAAANCNNTCMTIGSKQRFIEVCQCSGDEMLSYLSGHITPLGSPGIREMMPQFLPLVPQSLLEPRFPQISMLPPRQAPSSMFYSYLLWNPPESFVPLPPTPEWVSDFPLSPVLAANGSPSASFVSPLTPTDYFVN